MTNMDRPTPRYVPVSVIVPNFNSGGYLRSCIKSINTGTRPDEILIVDDASTDESPDIAAQLSSEHENVKFIRGARNEGPAAARRHGIEAAANEWIAPVDADDTVEDGAVAAAYETAIESGTDMCLWQLWKTDGEHSRPHVSLDPLDFPMTGREAARRTLGGWRIHPLGVVRKQLYVDAYADFSETCFNADELIGRRVLIGAKRVSLCAKKYLYMANPSSISKALHPRRLGGLDAQAWLVRFCIENGYETKDKIRLVENAIESMWWVYRHRKFFGADKALEKIKHTIPVVQQALSPGDWVRLNPKHVVAVFFLKAAVLRHRKP